MKIADVRLRLVFMPQIALGRPAASILLEELGSVSSSAGALAASGHLLKSCSHPCWLGQRGVQGTQPP